MSLFTKSSILKVRVRVLRILHGAQQWPPRQR
jgi:plasmid stabilization system protein ParE